ncbi:hypothetical protein SEUCBS139899_002128 [Sporothrix eucalyptigena]|uniref:Ketoreductase domain-containing protein n=1 Tax=Sporothrix eucalyptigena TaxID=1812306 RepID=A0ABP0B4G3_9PEZI
MPPKTLSIFSLEGKNCVVTGGAGGLGRECMSAFALSGANVACVDLSQDACDAAIRDVRAHVLKEGGFEAGKMRAYACNATNEKGVEATVALIVADFGRIDVLVTCAGICIDRAAEDVDLATWQKVLAVNLDGTYLFAREVGKQMLSSKTNGAMVFVSSAAAAHPPRPQAQASYNASKAAVNALAVSLATEWASRGIRVNSFSPGFMVTPLMASQTGKTSHDEPLTERQEEWLTQIPIGRFANPEEHRGTLVWMASNASSYLTGANIVSDGGWVHW